MSKYLEKLVDQWVGHGYKPPLEIGSKKFTAPDSPETIQTVENSGYCKERQALLMANLLQSKKRIRANARRAEVNKSRKSRIRTFVKNVELALESGNAEEASAALKAAQPELMRGVTKGVMHKKTASRKVSRLAKRVKALSA